MFQVIYKTLYFLSLLLCLGIMLIKPYSLDLTKIISISSYSGYLIVQIEIMEKSKKI